MDGVTWRVVGEVRVYGDEMGRTGNTRSWRVGLHDRDGLRELMDVLATIESRGKLLDQVRGEVIRDQKAKTLMKFPMAESFYYLKVWWDSNIARVLKNLYRGSFRGVREARGMLLLNEEGFKTPQLVAYGFARFDWLSVHSYLITEEVREANTLFSPVTCRDLSDRLKSISECVGAMHSRGVVFGDLHHNNVLVRRSDDKEEFYFLDPMGVKRSRHIGEKLSDIANFLYYAYESHCFENHGFAKIFLQGYYEATIRGKKDWMKYSHLERIVYTKINRKRRFRKLYRRLIDMG